jgi:histidine triad (HIT) family protein
MSPSCVFCRICAGEVPSVRVYEDEETVAFLDIAPIVKGHTLVVPRRHCERITDAPDAVLARLIAMVRRIADAQVRGLGADGVNVTQANGAAAGQVVPHLHFHVIPRFESDGHHWNWRSKSYADPEEGRGFAERIRAAVAS